MLPEPELKEFLDRLADKAWIGGSYKSLQNVFAHGDEKGLTKYFPYRLGHRGFHLSFSPRVVRRTCRVSFLRFRSRAIHRLPVPGLASTVVVSFAGGLHLLSSLVFDGQCVVQSIILAGVGFHRTSVKGVSP